jgi:hypothetical protein
MAAGLAAPSGRAGKPPARSIVITGELYRQNDNHYTVFLVTPGHHPERSINRDFSGG